MRKSSLGPQPSASTDSATPTYWGFSMPFSSTRSKFISKVSVFDLRSVFLGSNVGRGYVETLRIIPFLTTLANLGPPTPSQIPPTRGLIRQYFIDCGQVRLEKSPLKPFPP